VIPVVVLVVVMALVLYGEALTLTPNLRIGPNITYIEGRYFLPILPLLVLLPFSVPGTAIREGGRLGWAWTVPTGVVALAGWYAVLVAQRFY
jgi:hypothetical protein